MRTTEGMNPSILQAIIVALWLGAAGFFSAAVAPVLFAVLPTRTLAGVAVGRLLPVVFYSGMVIGAAVLALPQMWRRGWAFGGREIAGLIIIAACGVAQFVIGPRIARLRDEIGGPLEQLAADDARRMAFGRLHGISVAWLGVAMLAGFVVLVLAARALNNETRL